MSWMQEIDLQEHGVQLPTHDQWVDIPGSPFQVMTKGQDVYPVMWVRIRPTYAAYWNEFMSIKQAGGED